MCCRCTAATTTPAGPAPTGGCGAAASCCSRVTRPRDCGCRSTPSAGVRRAPSHPADPLARRDGLRGRCGTRRRRRPDDESHPPRLWSPRSGDGLLHVFLPPTDELEHFVDLVARVEAAAAKVDCPVVIEGYGPPSDPRLTSMTVTPDPGVIEVNVAPTATFAEQRDQLGRCTSEARLARLSTESFDVDGTHGGTGGGNHITLGGITPADSPLLRRPDLLVSMLTYWQRHPSLSYLFAGRFVGTTSQAPRVDEGRAEALYELEIAFAEIARLTGGAGTAKPWVTDRALRHLLTDITGNTHRAEFCIDKLYSPDSARGRLGPAGAARLRDAATLPDGDGAVAAGALAGRVVLGRAAARPADPPRRQPARPIPVAALPDSRHRRRRRRPARPRHQLRHQLAGPVHRVPLPAHRHRGVRRGRDRTARRHRAVERARRGVHRGRHGPLRRLVGGTHPGARSSAPTGSATSSRPTAIRCRCWPPTIPTSRSAACGSGRGSRPARCTRPSPSTGRFASSWSTWPPARPAAAARTTCRTPAAGPTTARPSTRWRPSRAAGAGSRRPGSRPGKVDMSDIREKQARLSTDVGAPGILDLRRVRTVLH